MFFAFAAKPDGEERGMRPLTLVNLGATYTEKNRTLLARTSESSLVIQWPRCHLKIQWNATENTVKFYWKPVKIYWKPVKLHGMTSATALKFPVAPGSLELS